MKILSVLSTLFMTIGVFMTSVQAGEKEKDHFIQIDQKGKKFSQNYLKIRVGDTVQFTNSDPLFHNIYSVSEPAYFDLGAYSKGAVREYRFIKPGRVEVGCVIHPFMKLIIDVKP